MGLRKHGRCLWLRKKRKKMYIYCHESRAGGADMKQTGEPAAASQLSRVLSFP